MSINQQVLDFFTTNYKPGAIGIVGTNDLIGQAIRAAQCELTADKNPSKWSHCFLLGDLRYDRRGPGNSISKSPYIFESDVKIDILHPEVRNGAQENWVGKWCNETVENAAIINFNLPDSDYEGVLSIALQLVDEQVLYPIQGLLGTWLAIITHRQWAPNPFNDPHAMYCSSFVRYCYKQANRDFVSQTISISNTTPEDVARAGIKAGKMNLFQPS